MNTVKYHFTFTLYLAFAMYKCFNERTCVSGKLVPSDRFTFLGRTWKLTRIRFSLCCCSVLGSVVIKFIYGAYGIRLEEEIERVALRKIWYKNLQIVLIRIRCNLSRCTRYLAEIFLWIYLRKIFLNLKSKYFFFHRNAMHAKWIRNETLSMKYTHLKNVPMSFTNNLSFRVVLRGRQFSFLSKKEN